MISATELNLIVNSYPDAPRIVIERDVMERGESPIYTLHRQEGDYTVTGLGWGHGHLFVSTREKGTTGISYEHEVTREEEETYEIPYDCCQTTLDNWGMRMTHADDVIKIISEILGDSWYTTEEVTAALGEYWESEKLTAKNPNQYTFQALRQLERRGEVERKTLPYCKYAYWKVIA